MAFQGQENTGCWHTRPLISFNQTMARWPPPCSIPNLLRIWYKTRFQLITTNRNWDPWMILTPSITKYLPRWKPTEIALSPRRHPSSSHPTRIRRSPPNHSYSRFTPQSRCGRSPRFASHRQKKTHCHRARCYFSPCQKQSGKRFFVRRRDGFDRSIVGGTK